MVTTVIFEWDNEKAEANIVKHGLAFEDAIAVSFAPMIVDFEDDREDYGEERRTSLGMVDGTLYSVTYTMRANVTRIISARLASRPVSSPPVWQAVRKGVSMMAKTTTVTIDPSNPPKMSAASRKRLAAMTDQEIEASAADELPYTPKMEKSIRTIHAIRRSRKATGLSQAKFAARYGFNTRTLQDWEQGRSAPDNATQNYLRLIENDPEGVTKVIAAE